MNLSYWNFVNDSKQKRFVVQAFEATSNTRFFSLFWILSRLDFRSLIPRFRHLLRITSLAENNKNLHLGCTLRHVAICLILVDIG